jgi:chemotaxis protein MotA
MGSIGGPPEEVGHKVAAALVGTFLGILLCYGLFSPLAANMSKESDAESQYLNFLRAAIVAFLKGSPPVLALEFGRRTIPHSVRPSFQELEKACKSGGTTTEAAAA